jgi:hypothetical protein
MDKERETGRWNERYKAKFNIFHVHDLRVDGRFQSRFDQLFNTLFRPRKQRHFLEQKGKKKKLTKKEKKKSFSIFTFASVEHFAWGEK